MDSPLHRLYRTKLALLATLCTGSGIALLFLTQSADWRWLEAIPARDIGTSLFTTGLVVIFFEYMDSRDADERTLQRMRTVVDERLPALRDAVIDGFATDARTLTHAAPATIDRIISNGLAARIGDTELAHDVYDDLRHQLLRTSERHYNKHITITLAPWTAQPDNSEPMFVATLQWDYHTNQLADHQQFSCVSNTDVYERLFRDPATAGVWHFPPHGALEARSPEAFQLVQYAMNGTSRPIRHEHQPHGQAYIVDTQQSEASRGSTTHISFTYRVLVSQPGHLLNLDFHKPSKGLRVNFHYGGCGIQRAKALGFITSAHGTRILRTSQTIAPSIHIGFDGWTFPKSGIAFTWTLDREIER